MSMRYRFKDPKCYVDGDSSVKLKTPHSFTKFHLYMLNKMDDDDFEQSPLYDAYEEAGEAQNDYFEAELGQESLSKLFCEGYNYTITKNNNFRAIEYTITADGSYGPARSCYTPCTIYNRLTNNKVII